MFEFHPLKHPKGFQMVTIPRVRVADHWDWHNPRLSRGLLGMSRVLPLPEVPFSGSFSPGDGTALTTLGSWIWSGSFSRLETPRTDNRERLDCSLPRAGIAAGVTVAASTTGSFRVWICCSGARQHLQKIKAAPFLQAVAGRQLNVLTLSHTFFSQDSQTS